MLSRERLRCAICPLACNMLANMLANLLANMLAHVALQPLQALHGRCLANLVAARRKRACAAASQPQDVGSLPPSLVPCPTGRAATAACLLALAGTGLPCGRLRGCCFLHTASHTAALPACTLHNCCGRAPPPPPRLHALP
jgi:hypothetical protein